MNPPLGSPPCNGCTACCKGDAIWLHPELGDDPSQYETVEYHHPLTGETGLILEHKQDGSCVYLDRDIGCTIYEKRPAICREFDCRGFYLKCVESMNGKARRKAVAQGYLSKSVLAQGRRLLKQSDAGTQGEAA